MRNKYGVPCSHLKGFIKDVDVHCPSEEIAISVAAGCWLAGENAEIYIQNSGLMHIADVVLSLFKPYNIPLPRLILSVRHSPEHHKHVGRITRDFLKMLDYDGKVLFIEEIK